MCFQEAGGVASPVSPVCMVDTQLPQSCHYWLAVFNLIIVSKLMISVPHRYSWANSYRADHAELGFCVCNHWDLGCAILFSHILMIQLIFYSADWTGGAQSSGHICHHSSCCDPSCLFSQAGSTVSVALEPKALLNSFNFLRTSLLILKIPNCYQLVSFIITELWALARKHRA